MSYLIISEIREPLAILLMIGHIILNRSLSEIIYGPLYMVPERAKWNDDPRENEMKAGPTARSEQGERERNEWSQS